jgi:hypothetical protein
MTCYVEIFDFSGASLDKLGAVYSLKTSGLLSRLPATAINANGAKRCQAFVSAFCRRNRSMKQAKKHLIEQVFYHQQLVHPLANDRMSNEPLSGIALTAKPTPYFSTGKHIPNFVVHCHKSVLNS